MCASAATLQLPIGTGSGDYGEVATLANFVLHDVSTDPVTLNTTAGPDLDVFRDLGTGTVYGNRYLPTQAPYGWSDGVPRLAQRRGPRGPERTRSSRRTLATSRSAG